MHDEFDAALHGAQRHADRRARHPADESWTATDLRAPAAGRAPRPDLPGRPLQRQQRAGRRLRPATRSTPTSSTRPRRGHAHGHHRVQRRLPLGVQHRRRRGRAGPDQPLDWAQAFAQQQAVLIGGTGYQYGDTDFLEYSERLYPDFARGCVRASWPLARTPVAVGGALAGQAGLPRGHGHLRGIHQKAVLEATLYGLPMTGFDAPVRAAERRSSAVDPTAVTTGAGGRSASAPPTYPVTRRPRAAPRRARPSPASRPTDWPIGATASRSSPARRPCPSWSSTSPSPAWCCAASASAAAPTPTPAASCRSPARPPRGSTANSTFVSAAFFPQRLSSLNYFGALADGGRTSLILTPASTGPTLRLADQQCAPSPDTSLRLFYSADTDTDTGGRTAGAGRRPEHRQRQRHLDRRRGVLLARRPATRPPASRRSGPPRAASRARRLAVAFDLAQNATDSTLWTGTLTGLRRPRAAWGSWCRPPTASAPSAWTPRRVPATA